MVRAVRITMVRANKIHFLPAMLNLNEENYRHLVMSGSEVDWISMKLR